MGRGAQLGVGSGGAVALALRVLALGFFLSTCSAQYGGEHTPPGKGAYVTFATGENYVVGALVMGYSIRRLGTAYEMIVLVTADVSQEERAVLSRVYNRIVDVAPVPCKTCGANSTHYFTKLRAWELTEYEKLVYIGADQIVMRPIEELFACRPPCAPYDMFLWETSMLGTSVNGDLFVLRPSREDFAAMAREARAWDRDRAEYVPLAQSWSLHFFEKSMSRRATHIGTYDQALLNRYYGRELTVLPFYYNLAPSVFMAEAQCDRSFLWVPDKIKVIHFTFHKPWSGWLHPRMRPFFDLWLEVAKELNAQLPFGPLEAMIRKHVADQAAVEAERLQEGASGPAPQPAAAAAAAASQTQAPRQQAAPPAGPGLASDPGIAGLF